MSHEKLKQSRRWRRMSKLQLTLHPLCVICESNDQVVPAEIADHIVPHRGDPTLFWTGKLQSLCCSCHNSVKQGEELRGYREDIGADGWPLDPRHPVNAIEPL